MIFEVVNASNDDWTDRNGIAYLLNENGYADAIVTKSFMNMLSQDPKDVRIGINFKNHFVCMRSIAFIPCIYIFLVSPKLIWRIGYNIFSNFECILIITFSQINPGKQGFCCPFINISRSLIFSKIT